MTRTLSDVRVSYAVLLEQDPNHGGACTKSPRSRRFLQAWQLSDPAVKARRLTARRARRKAARAARRVGR